MGQSLVPEPPAMMIGWIMKATLISKFLFHSLQNKSGAYKTGATCNQKHALLT